MARKNIKTRARKQRAAELVAANNWREAEVLYREICRIDPMDADSWLRLGAIYGQFNAQDEAERCTRKVLEIEPNNLTALANYAGVLILKGQFNDALKIYQKLLTIKPGNVRYTGCMSTIYEKLGERERAYELVSSVIDSSVYDVNIALSYGRMCTRVGDPEEAIRYGKAVLEHGQMSDLERVQLWFALGVAYDATGQYDDAFESYSRGNSNYIVNYDSHQFTERVDSLIETCDNDYLASLPRSTIDSQRPVFIIGMPRSGTSLVEQILACHSQVAGAGELTDIPAVINELCTEPDKNLIFYPHHLDKLEQVTLDEATQKYLAVLDAVDSDTRYVTDKLPDNFHNVGMISRMFPKAKLIHCNRNPMDTCLSCYFQYFQGWHPYAYDLRTLGEYYQQYRRIMDHWRDAVELEIFEVKYEELVEDQEKVTREMLAFLELEWEPQCLEHHKASRLINTASYDQVRRPIYNSSIERWRNYENYLEPLMSALGTNANN